MPFAFIVAMGGVGFENITVAGFEEAQDAGFVDYTGTEVVGEGGGEIFVFSVLTIAVTLTPDFGPQSKGLDTKKPQN